MYTIQSGELGRGFNLSPATDAGPACGNAAGKSRRVAGTMKVIAKNKKSRNAVAGLAVVLSCCSVLSVSAGCGRLTMDFDEMWNAAGDPGSPHVNRENYERVQEGMTYEDVAAVFGGPGYFTMEYTLGGDTLKSYNWVGRDEYNVSISFENGLVSRKSWWITGETEPEASEWEK